MRLLTPILLNQKPKLWSHEWFLAWQPLLLIAVNSPFGLGRDVRLKLGINLDIQIPIDRLMRNSFRIKIGFNEYQETFYCKPIFAIALKREWTWLWNLIHKWDMNFANHIYPKLNFGFDTLTKYPDAHPEITTVNGYLACSGDTYWSYFWGGSGGGVSIGGENSWSSNTGDIALVVTGSQDGYFSELSRVFLLFDTSTLGATVIISDVKLYQYITQVYTDLGGNSLYVVDSSPSSNINITSSDWLNVGSTSFASGTPSQNTLHEFTFTSTGRASVSKTDISKYALRNGWDLGNSRPDFSYEYAPGGYQGAGIGNTTSSDRYPKLVVTYSLPTNIGKQDVQNTMTQIRM